LGNLCISSWFRDKGFAMGAHMGAIGGALAHGRKELAHIGCVFEPNETNLGRWKTWWRYAVLDQTALWGLGCLAGMYLNVNLAAAIIPPGTQLAENQAGAYQAEYLATNLWTGFWTLALLNGFWILFSTHLGNTDCLVRTVTDICWTGHPQSRRWSASRLYAAILIALTAWALVSVHFGTVIALFKILGVMTSPIMAIAAVQILRVNTRFLPREIRPRFWRKAALISCAVVYGGLTAALLIDLAQRLFGNSG
jgi:hypothetical protein